MKITNNFYTKGIVYKKHNAKTSFSGWTPDENNRVSAQKIADTLTDSKNKKIAIVAHVFPDKDAYGSMFALRDLLELKGKEVSIFVEEYPYFAQDTRGVKVVDKHLTKNEFKNKYGKYDVTVSVDAQSKNRIAYQFKNNLIEKSPITIMIDHHESKSKDKFGDIRLIDPNISSNAQLIMQLVEPMGLKAEDLKTSTYEHIARGLKSDTGDFSHTKSYHAFADAALLRQRISFKDLAHKINEVSLKEFDLIHKVLSENVNFSQNGKVAYIIANEELDLKNKKVENHLIDELLNIKNVEVSFIIKEINNSQGSSVRMRSNNIDISGIARAYKGGGHKNIAAFSQPRIGVNMLAPILAKDIENNINSESQSQQSA